jgi:tetratricopeptide (TPR) repeat protein
VGTAFALAAGQGYEGLGEWEKAEEQYLKAGNDPAPGVQEAALSSVVRVRRKFREQKRQASLASAKLLEDQERWKEAEQSYLDLLKADPAAANEIADALARLRPRLTGKRWSEAFDESLAKVGRVLLVPSIALVIAIALRTIAKTRRSIQVLPFAADSDSGAKQMAFWLSNARAELRSPASTYPLSSKLTSGLPFIQMPDLQESMVEVPELEVGGVKLPLKQLTRIVSIPRVRVSGGWTVGTTSGDAHAEVERRRWFAFEVDSVAKRAIASTPGSVQDRDLQLFAYDVLIKAGNAYGR